MNKIKFFLVACFMGLAASASAQFANSSSSASAAGSSDAWQGIRVSYLPMKFAVDADGVDDPKLNALSFGYVKSFGIAPQLPIFLEVGGNLLFGFKDEDGVKEKLLSINIPVNAGYKWNINEKVSLFPYVGFNFRVNAMGKSSYEDEDMNWFDDDDMGGEAWKRFNVGFNIGVNCNIDRFVVGASFTKDFTELGEKIKINMPAITLGYNF